VFDRAKILGGGESGSEGDIPEARRLKATCTIHEHDSPHLGL